MDDTVTYGRDRSMNMSESKSRVAGIRARVRNIRRFSISWSHLVAEKGRDMKARDSEPISEYQVACCEWCHDATIGVRHTK